MVTFLSKTEFLTEASRWGAGKDSLIRVRTMRKGNFRHFMFYTPQGEMVETKVSEEDYNEVEFMNLAPISVPAVWFNELDQLKSINSKLEELNATATNPKDNSNPRLWVNEQ